MMEVDSQSLTLADVESTEIGDLPDPQQEFIVKLLEELNVLSQKHNGATRYLKAVLPTLDDKKDFGMHL